MRGPAAASRAVGLTAFQILWTLNIGFDAVYYISGLTDWAYLMTGLACLVALIRPHRWTLGAAWLASIALWWIASPMTTNHGFTIMIGSALALWAGAHDPRAAPTDRLVPPMMLFIAAVYGAAILQKLNTTYLTDLDASCAVALMDQWREIPGWLAPWLPPISLLVEGGLALGMLMPQTRLFTALCGTLFHFILGLSPVSPIYLFSLTMVGLYSAAWRRAPDLLLPVAQLALLGAGIGKGLGLAGQPMAGGLTFWVCWLITVPVVIFTFWRSPASARSPWPRSWPRPIQGAAVAAVVLPFVNTIPAYTGDRQFNSYDMYSNLEVDAAGSNHLFLPSLAKDQSFRRRVRLLSWEPDPTGTAGDREELHARLELVRLIKGGEIDRVVWLDGEEKRSWERGQPLPYPEITAFDLKTRRLRHAPITPACVDCPTCDLLRDALTGSSP